MFYTRSGQTFTVTTSDSLSEFLLKIQLPTYLCKKITATDAKPSGMVIKLVLRSGKYAKELENLLNNYY